MRRSVRCRAARAALLLQRDAERKKRWDATPKPNPDAGFLGYMKRMFSQRAEDREDAKRKNHALLMEAAQQHKGPWPLVVEEEPVIKKTEKEE